jgi:hypothetical protein
VSASRYSLRVTGLLSCCHRKCLYVCVSLCLVACSLVCLYLCVGAVPAFVLERGLKATVRYTRIKNDNGLALRAPHLRRC